MGEYDTVPGFGAELGQVVGFMLLAHAEGLEGLRQDVDKGRGTRRRCLGYRRHGTS